MTKHILKAAQTDLTLGILQGDQLVVEEATTAEPGEIVIAVIDGAASVRRYEPWMRVTGRLLTAGRTVA